jgi:thiamine-phosphate diphosphorylase
MAKLPRGFYGVVDVTAGPGVVDRARWLAAELLAAGAAILQVRVKKGGSGAFLEVARAVREVCTVPLVVNDRADIAIAAGADGIHLGQDDLPLAAARAIAPGLFVGISTHSLAQAMAAAAAGADYLGFGPIYPTGTKENPDPVVGVGQLARVVAAVAPLPVVAIGGITPARAAEIADAGAAAACVISAVNRAADVVAAGRQVAAAFA